MAEVPAISPTERLRPILLWCRIILPLGIYCEYLVGMKIVFQIRNLRDCLRGVACGALRTPFQEGMSFYLLFSTGSCHFPGEGQRDGVTAGTAAG